MNQELVEYLQDQGKSKEEIEKALSDEDGLRRRLEDHYMRLEVIKKAYESEQKIIHEEIIKIRNECKHYGVRYYPDASGNNDSSYVCTLCGKERRYKNNWVGFGDSFGE